MPTTPGSEFTSGLKLLEASMERPAGSEGERSLLQQWAGSINILRNMNAREEADRLLQYGVMEATSRPGSFLPTRIEQFKIEDERRAASLQLKSVLPSVRTSDADMSLHS